MAYSALTNNMQTHIQREIEYTSYSKAKMYAWFKTLGLFKPVGKGVVSHTYTKLEKMEPGEIIASLSAIPISTPRFTEATSTLMLIGTKISLSKLIIDRWMSSNLVDVAFQQVLNEQMKAITTQVDQCLSYGDTLKRPRTGDDAAGQSVFSGMFNGGTTFAAGDGADDDMTAAGDFISSIVNAIKALENAEHEGKKYFIFSDNNTYHQAELGVHQLKTQDFVTEIDAINRRKDIQSWIHSPNFTNPSAEKRIVVTNPYNNLNPKVESKEKSLAYRMLIGYDFEVTPLFNGGLSGQGNYEWIILWSGVLQIINSGSIQASGNLTLT